MATIIKLAITIAALTSLFFSLLKDDARIGALGIVLLVVGVHLWIVDD